MLNHFHLTTIQWAILCIGALGIGFSKTAVNGVGILSVALFAIAISGIQSVGVVLPILISADIISVKTYHRRASWPHLWRLFPWAAAGVVLGWAAIYYFHPNEVQIKRVIGWILIVVLSIQFWREREHLDFDDLEKVVPHSLWFTAVMGLLGGITTMLANAAGPIMILYLLSTRLPKLEHIGTGAWYFLVLNCFKVPFMVQQNTIDSHTLALSVCMMPLAICGALIGRSVIHKLNQELFNKVAFGSAFVAALSLVGLVPWLIHQAT